MQRYLRCISSSDFMNSGECAEMVAAPHVSPARDLAWNQSTSTWPMSAQSRKELFSFRAPWNAKKLRALLSRPGPVLAVGAHSPLTACLAEEARFDVIWASGFEISAAHAVPDANILSMAEQLLVAKQMARRVSIPASCSSAKRVTVTIISS